MKALSALPFFRLLIVISSILPVTAEKLVMPIDPLKVKWMSDQETEALLTEPMTIPAPIAAELRAYLATIPAAKEKNWLPLKTNLLTNPPAITFASTDPFLRDKNPALEPILRRLAELPDPVIQFSANLSLAAAHADTGAVQRLIALTRKSDYSPQQAEILQNLFHGMGIDPSQDTSQEIFAMLGTNFESENRDQNRIPIGHAAPDFTINTVAGKKITLSGYRGKPVLLHFWSTTCGPCLADFPELVQFVNETAKHRDLVVIAVSLDDDLSQIEKAIEKHGLKDFINVCDGRGWGSKPARLYKIRAIPSDVVIKTDGTIAGFQRELLNSE